METNQASFTHATLLTPLPPFSVLEQVTDAELSQYAELIYRRTGIRVSPQKKTLLSNRVRRRLRQTGAKSFAEYLEILQRLPSHDKEWDAFLQEITTHETYLFRDEIHWDWFRRQFLPQMAATGGAGGGRWLRIWSAACSTGDEVFTIACSIAACLPNFQQWKIQIVGTDIGIGAVQQASIAVFGQRAMRLVPEDYRRRFFTQAGDGQVWQARPILRDMVAFRQHNLLDPLREKPFDLAFLKNVLIYFDAASKKQVLANMRAAVRPGGLLVAGAAEGIGDLLQDFVRLQPWLYRRVEEPGRCDVPSP